MGLTQEPNEECEVFKDSETKKEIQNEMILTSDNEKKTSDKIFDIGAGISVSCWLILPSGYFLKLP
jgi:hypothetical protein